MVDIVYSRPDLSEYHENLVGETLRVQVMSTTSEFDVGNVITSGDEGAYFLEIEFMDAGYLDQYVDCVLRFVRGDGEVIDVSADIDGNRLIYLLDHYLYEIPGLTCWVRLTAIPQQASWTEGYSIITPLKIYFSNIRLSPPAPVGTPA
jgi:hypothetical protein